MSTRNGKTWRVLLPPVVNVFLAANLTLYACVQVGTPAWILQLHTFARSLSGPSLGSETSCRTGSSTRVPVPRRSSVSRFGIATAREAASGQQTFFGSAFDKRGDRREAAERCESRAAHQMPGVRHTQFTDRKSLQR